MIYKFDCPFGFEDDCDNELNIEVDEGCIYDVEGCLTHIPDSAPSVAQCKILYDMLEDKYREQYEDAMEARVDSMRDREFDR